MALKVKAVERLLKFTKNENDPGVYRYVMKPELYIALSQAKVIKEAALRSGVSQGVMKACWDAAGEVIKAWATEGHAVPMPGLGTMRFGLRSKSVEKVEDVKTGLIKSRRIIFTPSVDLKDELANAAIQITCYDRTGKEVKRVTSADDGTIEDPEETSPNPSEGGESEIPASSGHALTISKSGSGSASVTHNGNAVTSGANLNEDDEVAISITPAEGQTPTATINGSSIELTEDGGVYTGSFAMPGQASTLVINTGENDDYNPIDTGD